MPGPVYAKISSRENKVIYSIWKSENGIFLTEAPVLQTRTHVELGRRYA